jgi:hypothetical protein
MTRPMRVRGRSNGVSVTGIANLLGGVPQESPRAMNARGRRRDGRVKAA